MMVYLTFGNQSNGVFASYVTEVCKYINAEFKTNIKVVSFVSIRNFRITRSDRKKMYPNSIILPMFPRMVNWRFNIVLLVFVWPFIGKKNIIALSPIAANLALQLKKIKFAKKVIYDAEGATAAEWNEYDVVGNGFLKKTIYGIEKKAVNESDFRRTVSSKMIDYWKDTFQYTADEQVVIPCSLNSIFMKELSSTEKIAQQKTAHGYSGKDVIIVYSGSSAQWQSFEIIAAFLENVFGANEHVKLLMLTDAAPNHIFFKQYASRITIRWVNYNEVPGLLEMCDYGILMRESSTTNKVAAPTKFAEYLSCGLKVLISPGIGDYSDFVLKHNCGYLVTSKEKFNKPLSYTDYQTKMQLNQLARTQFAKSNFKKEFAKMITIFQK
jgi:hypothetical protein